MNDLFERFRYRFQLSRRTQAEDYLGSSEVEPLPESETDYVSFYSGPKSIIRLKESTIRSVGRIVQVYFGIIIIVSWICSLLVRSIPSARFAIGVSWLVLVAFWTLAMILDTVQLSRARKQYRERLAAKSSNQAMERTADRRTLHF
ncbi:MAG TPA: hypothetical protein VGI60_00040 [Chthoniobacterales bacterium]|jgi:uncharacterized membrane protein (DUF485 family)